MHRTASSYGKFYDVAKGIYELKGLEIFSAGEVGLIGTIKALHSRGYVKKIGRTPDKSRVLYQISDGVVDMIKREGS